LSANLSFFLDGKKVNPPKNHLNLQVEATFINATEEGALTISPQANVDVDAFDWVTDGSDTPNKAARLIKQWIADGLTKLGPGIFEGMPLQILAKDAVNSEDAFNGILDLPDGFIELDPVQVRSKSRETASLNVFGERAQGVTFGFLLARGLADPSAPGVITPSDFVNVKYVVEKKVDPISLIIAGITIFIMVKELVEAIKQLAADTNTFVRELAGGLLSAIADIVWAILNLLVQLAYIIIITIAIIKLIRDLINQLISPIRRHKAMRLRTLLEKATTYLGFELESPLTELDDIVYLPSSPDEEEPHPEGIPKPQDFGYKLDEMYDLIKRIAYAKLQLIDGKLQLRSFNDPFWIKTSTYVLPGDPNGNGLLYETVQYNTPDFRANRLIQFLTDVSDSWTVNNFQGTNFEVITTPIQTTVEENVLMKGIDQVQIPCALGNRKQSLNAVEKVVLAAAQAADAFVGGSRFASLVKRRVGMLKISDNVHSVPKLIVLDSTGAIPPNHRTTFSAKALYNKYHNEKSFVANDFGGQYQIFKEVTVPFGFKEFLSLIKNSHFTNFDGRLGKVDSIKWVIGGDKAILDYRIREPYTKNMEETEVEPS